MNRLHNFNGSGQPQWKPELSLTMSTEFNSRRIKLPLISRAPLKENFFFLADNVFSKETCGHLIDLFLKENVSPVGIDGYRDTSAADAIGSFRANAWSTGVADQVTLALSKILSGFHTLVPTGSGFSGDLAPFGEMPIPVQTYRFLGSTPFLRFMKYPTGGKHVPHYDAPFVSEKYMTLMSWVLYLNTPAGTGGAFQFVDDKQWDIDVFHRDRSDWRRMAEEDEILYSVSPQLGRLLVLPHWLPHQVQLFEGDKNSWRYIIRGDVAYEW